MRNNGETNPVTYLLAALFAGVCFYGFHVGPVYWDNLNAKEAAAEAYSSYLLNGEKVAIDNMLIRLNARSPDTSHYEVNEDGVESIQLGYGLTEDNVKVILDEANKKLTIRIEYDRIVEFKPLKKRKSYHLVAEKTGSIGK